MNLEAVAEAVDRFAGELGDYEAAAKAVEARVRTIADGVHIKCSVSSRAKDPRSFHKKIIVKQYDRDPYGQVTDKCGVRVVVEAPRHVDDLSRAIEVELGEDWIRTEDKREVLDPEKLGYSGVHMQLHVEAPTVGRVECEVQLRTAAQDAWSIVSHQILYKPLLALPKEMQHRAYRLVALVEMFDEEVQRLMDAAAAAPGSEVADLLNVAEPAFLKLAHSPSNSQLSVMILQGVVEAFSTEERANYGDLMAAFVESERESLEALFKDYGPHSAVSYIPDYVLFGQAESLILLERLNAKPHLLLDKWQASGLPESYLSALAGAAGLSLPGE